MKILEDKMNNGYLIYEDEHIVCIITGLVNESANKKTGAEVQVWILVKDLNPVLAVNAGKDKYICGDCKHRGEVLPLHLARTLANTLPSAKKRNLIERIDKYDKLGIQSINIDRTCYVTLFQAPLNIWKKYKKGGYDKIEPHKLQKLLKDRVVRIGAYGDPAFIPLWFWDIILKEVEASTGYTHQWKVCNKRMAKYCMASVDTPEEKIVANSLGYRTFRVKTIDDKLEHNEVGCLSDKIARQDKPLVSCIDCKMCGGLTSKVKSDITIIIHGSKGNINSYHKVRENV
jgi:hypothetical protein